MSAYYGFKLKSGEKFPHHPEVPNGWTPDDPGEEGINELSADCMTLWAANVSHGAIFEVVVGMLHGYPDFGIEPGDLIPIRCTYRKDEGWGWYEVEPWQLAEWTRMWSEGLPVIREAARAKGSEEG